MYRPAIMGLLFCASILLGAVLHLYLTQSDTQAKSEESKILLDLNEDDLDDLSDFCKYLEEFDCELLREEHERDHSNKTY